jgi:hypothetical protein
MEYTIDQIKDLYCKFKCRVKHSQVVSDENDDDEPYFNMCSHCQINNFI